MTKYGIEITYSWGDEEDIDKVFDTAENAFRTACELAGREMYVQNEEFFPENTCTIYANAANLAIDLHYVCDDTWCYYRIVDVT